MTDPGLEEYAARKGWNLKPEGRNLVLTDPCPFCDHKGKLKFLAATGQWTCWHAACGKKGNVLTLKRDLGDLVEARAAAPWRPSAAKPAKVYARPPAGTAEKYHDALMAAVGDAKHAARPALEWLMDVRGFSVETLRHFRVGYARKSNGSEWVAIPFFDGEGCSGIKFRSLPPAEKVFMRWPDCRSELFNAEAVRDEGIAIICEGEFDAMAWHQLGFPNVCSGSAGAGTWDESWSDALAGADTLLMAYDGDDSGQKGALAAVEKLGKYRCRLVSLPLKDANDCLAAGYDRVRMGGCLANAQPFGFREVKHVRDLIPKLLEQQQAGWRGDSTGIRAIDARIGGWRPDELTILTGDSGSGKSTFATFLAYLRAVAEVPVLIASFEMPTLSVVRKLFEMECSRGSVETAAERLSSRPIWLLDIYGETALPVLRDSVYYAVRSRRCQLVVLDHLHFIIGTPNPDTERSAIGEAMRQLKRWGRDLQVPFLVVAHPAKSEYENAVVTPNMLRGSSEIKQLADNIWSIWRERPGSVIPPKVAQTLPAEVLGNSKRVAFIAHKVRSELGSEGHLPLEFDLPTQTYRDLGAQVIPIRPEADAEM